MKKSRIFSALLVLALLSTCVIGGTFAKYVTSADATDTARVAKFGVTITAEGDLFDKQYTATDTNKGTITVAASADAKIVAPGTGTGNGATTGSTGKLKFTVAGTPEVATRVVITPSSTKVIKLAAGDYTLAAGKFYTKEVAATLNSDYEPIKWTLTKDGTAVVTDGTLTDLTTALTSTVNNAAGTNLAAVYEISWKWDFEGTVSGAWKSVGGVAGTTPPYTDATLVDFFDTYLGDEATAQTEDIAITFSITQLD